MAETPSALASFHPTVARWFSETLGLPTLPQVEGWPTILKGEHTLIAAPTGSGKTLAAFLAGLDALLREPELPDETRLLYISPLKALGNDVQKNLEQPLAALRELDPTLPQVRVVVRSGDTPPKVRASMTKTPPQIVVTTPESLYILLTSDGGRRMLSSVRTVVVDEIHALAGSKRGSHLALSLERLEALTSGPLQRIGLSATQKPIEEIAQFLVGVGRRCEIVDGGHRRELDLAMEIPDSPLETICSHETWDDIYERITQLVAAERTTLVFVNTRKLAERVSARLADRLGEEAVTAHHGSLSRERRLDAENRLKRGDLRALVATASLELGIDIGDVDLVVQVGATRSIATFLQRVGRAGHGVGRIPKGRLFPLTRDEIVEGAALLRAVRAGELDRIHLPPKPLDILAQHLVAACVPETWDADALYAMARKAWPYRELTRDEFEATVDLHTSGRLGLLHRDGVGGRIRGTKRARLPAVTSGGAIPDNADYRVLEEPSGTLVGTINEDFAIESSQGDVFQLGTTSWQVFKIEPGILRVVSAKGAPPTLPFWLGEAPARTTELSAAYADLRETCAVLAEQARDALGWLVAEAGIPRGAAQQIHDYVVQGRKDLGGASPSQSRLVIERFFDESGGSQLVVHSPFGGRINRAYGLALRKRFCRGFGFELQAAATEDAILLSLGPQHSFPLEEVFDYLSSKTARELLIQALLDAPMFTTRWRWNVTRALVVPRSWGGKKVPSPILRMRATDALVAAFPQVEACGETLPPGDLEVPMEHPLVRQTIEDCLHEAMDIEGFLELLRGLEDGSIERVAVDTPEPSVFALAILNANPYAFLDDAPLEERRAQAVSKRRGLSPEAQDTVGALDPAAIARVRAEAWPTPVDAEEVHEALTWMGYVTSEEAPEWLAWLTELHAAARVEPVRVGDDVRWFASEASRDPLEVWRGRLEVLGPVETSDGELYALENEGLALRVRYEGKQGWCHRRLLARIQRYTLNALRREIEPVNAETFWRFLAHWQHAVPERMLEGPQGTFEVLQQLAGFEAPAAEWERSILPARVRGYRRSYLDDLTLSGRIAWGRLWAEGAAPVRTTPICLVPREDLDAWLGLAGLAEAGELVGAAGALHRVLAERGAQFAQDLQRRTRLLPEPFERALSELITRGLVTCDSYAGVRALVVTPARRRYAMPSAGRWSLFRDEELDAPTPEALCRVLLRRTGVVFKRTLAREKLPVPWRELHRAMRRLELRGEVRGGRFVSGFSGEQFALPEAIRLLRRVRKQDPPAALSVAAADPLNFQGILTPDEKVARSAKQRVVVVAPSPLPAS